VTEISAVCGSTPILQQRHQQAMPTQCVSTLKDHEEQITFNSIPVKIMQEVGASSQNKRSLRTPSATSVKFNRGIWV
jgi:hypothetical protein